MISASLVSAVALSLVGSASSSEFVRVNLSKGTVRNGGSLRVDATASKKGHIRISLRKREKPVAGCAAQSCSPCPRVFRGGSFLAEKRNVRRLSWKGTLDEVNDPGRYNVCVVWKPASGRALATAAPLKIR